MKPFRHESVTEPYICVITEKKYRSAYVEFKCGVALVRIETGRCDANRVPLRPEARLYMSCDIVEDKLYVNMQYVHCMMMYGLAALVP